MKIIFFGTPEFAAASLKALFEAGFEIAGVFTESPKPMGRHQTTIPSPVKVFAEKNNLPVFEPERAKSPEVTATIKTLAPDIAIVAAYGQILPKELLAIPKFGFVNIHPSLLPKYRGASPVQSAILNGETETGVTIMLMDEKMDHGQILAQEKISIEDDEDTPSLLSRTAELGARILPKIIKNFIAGKIKPVEQNHAAATFTKILKKEDGKIEWDKSAAEIYNLIRAFRPWPGAWSNFQISGQSLRVKIISAYASDESATGPVSLGEFFKSSNGKLAVKCGKNAVIIEKLTPEGKKEMTGEEFVRGYLR